ncbi:outer membrane protein Iml2/Tetratricopeptide repeat protein 39 [Pisolithus tinctorius]|nr:outer membrane protein Iml2/Tetratricopeptide repeat protein 39 [Pisolithus tinctorius]
MVAALDAEEILRLEMQCLDLLFENKVEAALDVFKAGGQEDSPFLLKARGICALLNAALGMEPELVEDAAKDLTLAEKSARKHMKLAKSTTSSHRFQPGIEWEVIRTDAIVFLGLTRALSESLKGYILCLYELNKAYSTYKKLFKTVYPNGLDAYVTARQSAPAASHNPSKTNLQHATTTPSIPVRLSGFLARWTGLGNLTKPKPVPRTIINPVSGSVEELILSSAALGYGLCNLVLYSLPATLRNLVGFLGYSHDRQLALKALEVSAAGTDLHAVIAGLVLIAYYGGLLLASGYQADEKHIIDQYTGIVGRVLQQHPRWSLWILNKAKIQRMTGDPKGAIITLQEGLQLKSLPQVDAWLALELAWTLFQCRQYEASAQAFTEVAKMKNWSHATYHFLAAGCYVCIGQLDKAQKMFNALPEAIDKRRRNMPIEVFIKKKLEFYKAKHTRRGGDPERFVESMKISPAEEFAIVWNAHAHADKESALAHIEELTALTPPMDIQTEYVRSSSSVQQPWTLPDLDTSDEFAVRSFILGILHRTLGDYAGARKLLHDALKHYQNGDVNSWVGGVTHFELAVLDMKEGEQRSAAMSEGNPVGGEAVLEVWNHAIKSAKDALARARALCTRETDLSSRLGGRIMKLREEIDMKVRQLRD